MVDVKVTTCAPAWHWARQTPEEGLVWGPFRFHVDTPIERCDAWVVFESLSAQEETVCAPENVLFIAGEPDSIGSYHPDFLRQFFYVVSGRDDLQHARQIRTQQGHPWFVEKSFDELINMPPIPKTHDICVISSDKAFTEGHKKRLEFVEKLKTRFGDRVDVWGRGIRDFNNKWDVLAPYKYAIVLENFASQNWLTEKLPDALLAYCFPIYWGCENLQRYFSDDSCLRIDINDPEAVLTDIERLLTTPDDYSNRVASISRARLYYLNHLQFFANLANVLQLAMTQGRPAKNIKLMPNSAFPEISESILEQTAAPISKPSFGLLSNIFGKLGDRFKL